MLLLDIKKFPLDMCVMAKSYSDSVFSKAYIPNQPRFLPGQEQFSAQFFSKAIFSKAIRLCASVDHTHTHTHTDVITVHFLSANLQ